MNKNTILIYCDKLSISKTLAPYFINHFPSKNKEIKFINNLCYGNFDFVYPDNIHSYPVLQNPKFKIANLSKFVPSILDKNGTLQPTTLTFEEIRDTTIIFASQFRFKIYELLAKFLQRP